MDFYKHLIEGFFGDGTAFLVKTFDYAGQHVFAFFRGSGIQCPTRMIRVGLGEKRKSGRGMQEKTKMRMKTAGGNGFKKMLFAHDRAVRGQGYFKGLEKIVILTAGFRPEPPQGIRLNLAHAFAGDVITVADVL